ncbi:MAG: translation initiation factor IF-3 [Clostridia bacterium]|nr:translation initiation factor IF-3 [Clostridia bacterium]
MLSTFFLGVHVISKEHVINEKIKDKEVRLIGSEGEQLGIVSADKALEIAAEKNLDLVKIAPNAVPPVCKIMDYGKFRFELAKKEKEQRKNQKIIETKEVRLTPNIDDHDFYTKVNNAKKFLKSGNKVKVTVRFRGREVTHSSLGEELLIRFEKEVAEVGAVDKKPKMEGRNMSMFVSPKGAEK